MKDVINYTISEKIFSSLSSLVFLIPTILPEAPHLNKYIYALTVSSILCHGSEMILDECTFLVRILEKIDYICIILISTSHFNFNAFLVFLTVLTALINNYTKILTLSVLFGLSIRDLWYYDLKLMLMTIIILMLSFYYYFQCYEKGWQVHISWYWHILVTQFFIAIKCIYIPKLKT